MLWRIQGEAPLPFAELFSEALEPFCLSTSFYEKDDESIWCFMGLTDHQPDEVLITNSLKEAAHGHAADVPSWEVEEVPEVDWLEENYRSFPPLTLGSLYLYGSHHEAPPPGVHALLMDAATAFGSGHHGTTAGCLKLLSQLSLSPPPSHILDLGCGSGILAMAAALLYPEAQIWAFDNDPEAVRVSEKNIQRNHLSGRIHTGLSEGFQKIQQSSFDLILANILADPLIHLSQAIGSASDRVILSGYLSTQAEDVHAAYKVLGFDVQDILLEGPWVAAFLARSL